MNSSPLVSIVVATYNQEKNVVKTIESILAQTYLNIEVIVSDDCSSDQTPKILQGLSNKDRRIRLFLQDENLGITKNYNFLAEKIKGKYVAWFSGDDIMFEEKIERQVDLLEHDAKASFSHHAVTVIDAQTEEVRKTVVHSYRNQQTTLVDVIKDMGVSGSMSMMCRADMLENPVFNPSISTASDWLQIIDVASKGYGLYIQDPLCFYRKDDTYNGKNPVKYEADFTKTLDLAYEKYGDEDGVKEAIGVARDRYLLGAAFRSLLVGGRANTRALLNMRTHAPWSGRVSAALFVFSLLPIPKGILVKFRLIYHQSND